MLQGRSLTLGAGSLSAFSLLHTMRRTASECLFCRLVMPLREHLLSLMGRRSRLLGLRTAMSGVRARLRGRGMERGVPARIVFWGRM